MAEGIENSLLTNSLVYSFFFFFFSLLLLSCNKSAGVDVRQNDIPWDL